MIECGGEVGCAHCRAYFLFSVLFVVLSCVLVGVGHCQCTSLLMSLSAHSSKAMLGDSLALVISLPL